MPNNLKLDIHFDFIQTMPYIKPFIEEDEEPNYYPNNGLYSKYENRFEKKTFKNFKISDTDIIERKYNNFYLCMKDEYMDFILHNKKENLDKYFTPIIKKINERNIVWCFRGKAFRIFDTKITKVTYNEESYCKIYSETNFEYINNIKINENKSYDNVIITKNIKKESQFFNELKFLNFEKLAKEKMLYNVYVDYGSSKYKFYLFKNYEFETKAAKKNFRFEKAAVGLKTDLIQIKKII